MIRGPTLGLEENEARNYRVIPQAYIRGDNADIAPSARVLVRIARIMSGKSDTRAGSSPGHDDDAITLMALKQESPREEVRILSCRIDLMWLRI